MTRSLFEFNFPCISTQKNPSRNSTQIFTKNKETAGMDEMGEVHLKQEYKAREESQLRISTAIYIHDFSIYVGTEVHIL